MNSKNIKKVLNHKFNQWVNSIEDKKTQDLVKKNSIITGGSLVSLILGEKVSDYDIYFRTKETVLAVANYYVNKFKQQTEIKLGNVDKNKSYTPEIIEDQDRVKIVIQSVGVVGENSNEVPYEYFEAMENGQELGEDYISRITQGNEVHEDVLENNEKLKKFRPVFMSANAITLSDKIQIIIRFYGEPEEIHKNYDFIHCTNYWTSWDDKVVFNMQALESILNKQLYYVGSLYPICSMIRIRKFINRGWSINAGQMLKIAFQISELDLSNYETLEDQLIGVDSAYFSQFIESCKKRSETDPNFILTQPYIASVIDKIF